ncbi:MAG TPA: phosphoglycerate mutase family protein [Gaiellaceae bacterium]|nr:phosphoglycerate mutase family protein [Gaiellaceae bacterium]
MSLLLIRHALAGHRDHWERDDRLRPVDQHGRLQSDLLVDVLAGYTIDRIVSSPYLRCVQTVEPLADARGVEIELDEQLGATRLDELPDVLERLRGEKAAICTHGDLPWLGDRKFKKGATWVLDGELEPRRYIKPPA